MVLLLTILFLLWSLSWLVYASRSVQIGYRNSEKVIPFSRHVLKPAVKMLFVGDSTAKGVGASIPAKSVAGLLAVQYPKAAIHNVSINGAKAENVVRQLTKLDTHYDVMLIHVGGNDIVKLTPYSVYRKHIKTVLRLAQEKSRYVLLVPTGNVGTIRIFPLIVRWYFEHRTKRIRHISLQAVNAAGDRVRYVDFFVPKLEDPFYLSPEYYFSEDRFHPNDAGYTLWMPRIMLELAYFDLK